MSDDIGRVPSLDAAGGLLATVVHDLRNPLSTVRTNLDFVVREPRAPDALEALADAQSAVLELARALDQVVHLARALMGEAAYEPSTADVVSMIRADERLASVEMSLEGDGPFVCAHGGLVATLVSPLVEIARATPGARIARLSVRRVGQAVLVAVLDDGPPLTEELARHALTPQGPRLLRDRASSRRGRYGGLYAIATIAGSVGITLTLGERDGLACAELSFPV